MKFLTRRIEDKIRITRYQGEELKHFQLIGRLMSELGVDMGAYVKNRRKAGARFAGDEADTQIEDWIDDPPGGGGAQELRRGVPRGNVSGPDAARRDHRGGLHLSPNA
jgi:hypothetical protein